MTPVLLLVHGWGFGGDFWGPMLSRLAGVEAMVWDLGFHGAPARPLPPAGRPVVAVGHSLGLLWLLEKRPLVWDRLVSINGFARFTAGDGFADGVAPKILRRMIRRFADDPGGVFSDFMARCGAGETDAPSLDAAGLLAGLEGLAYWDHLDDVAVDLALAARDDPIVPPPMAGAALGGASLAWHDGGHLLPRTAPGWCADRLMELVEAME